MVGHWCWGPGACTENIKLLLYPVNPIKCIPQSSVHLIKTLSTTVLSAKKNSDAMFS